MPDRGFFLPESLVETTCFVSVLPSSRREGVSRLAGAWEWSLSIELGACLEAGSFFQCCLKSGVPNSVAALVSHVFPVTDQQRGRRSNTKFSWGSSVRV